MIGACDQVAKERAAEGSAANKTLCKMKCELLLFSKGTALL